MSEFLGSHQGPKVVGQIGDETMYVSPPQERRSNAELDPLVDDYQTIVANMESVVHCLPGQEVFGTPIHGTPDVTRLMRLLHSRDGICSEAGEYADQFKRHVYYHKPLNETNLIEELGDLIWYIALACNVLGITIRQVQIANAMKLKKRYPDKFTVENATNRDVDAEMEALQAGLKQDNYVSKCEPVGNVVMEVPKVERVAEGQIVYLACPRLHQDFRVMNARFAAANTVTSKLMKSGKLVFSPVSHGHYIGLANDWTWEQWKAFDCAMLSRCSNLYVLKIAGWQESRGVQGEIEYANSRGMPISYLPPEDFGITFNFPHIIPELKG